ncbi:Asp-tRNA(Asn)/Glu-tRNA(Gln) amidotransferase subunit GatA [Basilea psittacipulmonis]|uniref:Glutamyl-tRNA(Gln) amidotransferase subunit A n=1 Tax=Basilea psittacipulmonis DSM 24701 TaxID=1072685 RepID=A0A077DB54_9BURK|nr:Asp-tRNA(Asn)/Glu-tRNA(Gln) amidotransferase subunit GatA [Basilea psittacipulmonis]AIL32110.1 glutamyl-tRNA amidotransferase [Basilea psittacipulmonis DSM 24701]
MTELNTLKAVRQALDTKKVSAVELAQKALQKAESLKKLNLFIDIQPELTLAQAKAADERIASGQASFLTGLPIAHKDLFVTQGWRTTASSKMLENYTSPFDATVVSHLLNAGTVNIGKLSCDEFAMGSGNENSAFGPVLNPWDTQAVPGGSSGASAAAVAADIVLATTGTDTGGSIRQPAALCGISGIKPTYGTVSRFGMIAFASSLDQGGVFARSAQDLTELLDCIASFDPKDATSVEFCHGTPNAQGRIKKDYLQALERFSGPQPLKGLRIGIPKEYFSEGLSQDVKIAVEAALKEFEQLGATLVDISLPLTELAIPAYYVIAPAEASSNLSRYDAVRYGHRTQHYQHIEDMTSRSRSEAFGPEVQRRIMIGTYVLSQGYYDAYYLQAQRIRRMIANSFKDAFAEKCDVIMGPVSPTVAKNIGETRDDPTADWLADIYTLSPSLAGLPGMSIPCGFGHHHRPIGLQLIGNYFKEGELLAIAHQFQEVTNWHTQKPEIKL